MVSKGGGTARPQEEPRRRRNGEGSMGANQARVLVRLYAFK